MNKIASERNYKIVTAGSLHRLSQIIKNLPNTKDLAGYISAANHIVSCEDEECENTVIGMLDPSLWHLTFDPKEEGGSSISLIKAGDVARITSELFRLYSKSLEVGEANDKAENIVTRILVEHSIVSE